MRGLLPLPGLGGAGGGAAGTVHCTLYCTVQVGLLAGPVFLAADKLLLRLGIDDPVSAIPVNGGGGGGIVNNQSHTTRGFFNVDINTSSEAWVGGKSVTTRVLQC